MVEKPENHGFADRVLDLIDQRDGSDRAKSIEMTGRPDFIRDLRRRGQTPRESTLVRIADYLDVSVDWLLTGKTEARVADFSRDYRPPEPELPALPVLGTALGADGVDLGIEDDTPIEYSLYESDRIELYVGRPRYLANDRDAYAIFMQGDSMAPRHRNGALLLVETRHPPQGQDDVIVQIYGNEIDPDTEAPRIAMALVKTFIRQTGTYVELEQYNPAARFRIARTRVARMHRIVTNNDIYS